MLIDLIRKKNLSVLQCSKIAGIPYTTMLDLASEKTNLLKCNTGTVYHLAKALNVSMEELIEPYKNWEINTESWDNYKSTIQHMVKEMGDRPFILDVVKNKVPFYYYRQMKMKECLYLVSMIDYLCRVNNLKQYPGFEPFRQVSLKEPLFPTDVLLLDAMGVRDKSEALKNAIPEFLRCNIVEGEILEENLAEVLSEKNVNAILKDIDDFDEKFITEITDIT